jgi:hypothetical protein
MDFYTSDEFSFFNSCSRILDSSLDSESIAFHLQQTIIKKQFLQ